LEGGVSTSTRHKGEEHKNNNTKRKGNKIQTHRTLRSTHKYHTSLDPYTTRGKIGVVPSPSINRIGFLSFYDWGEEVGGKLERISRRSTSLRGKIGAKLSSFRFVLS
jgi:hypothetical protein